MKITLVEPKAPGKHVFSLVNMPRLGLPLLGARLKELGFEVEIFFASNEEMRLADILNTDLLGISTTTSTVLEAYRLADFAKAHGIPVVMGGAHVSFISDEALMHCDYVCRGEADNSFPELVSYIFNNKIPWDIPGVSFKNNGEIFHNELSEKTNVDLMPSPDFSLFRGLKKMSTYPIMTSRGCPYDCSFCSVTSMFGHKYRCRSNENILEEMKQYKNKKVFFVDDNFTANPKRTKELLREMIKNKLCPKLWGAQVRTDAANDEELLQLMYDSGCRTVYVGMESVNPETLKRYNKKQDVDDIAHCIKMFHKYKIMLHGMFVFGSDDDTSQTIEETLQFALKNKIDTVQFLILTPLPGTRTYNELEKDDRLLNKDWSLYDAHHVVFSPLQMTAQELQVNTIKAFKNFYSFKNIFSNLFITGFKSIVFRAVGYWLVRKWEKENQWYFKVLNKDKGIPDHILNFFGKFSKSIEVLKISNLKYLSKEKLLNIDLFQENGTFFINVKGLINDFSMEEMFKTIYNKIPYSYQDLVIHLDEMNFSSEETLLRFIDKLNTLADKAKQVQLQMPTKQNVIELALEKYNLKIPNFHIVVK